MLLHDSWGQVGNGYDGNNARGSLGQVEAIATVARVLSAS